MSAEEKIGHCGEDGIREEGVGNYAQEGSGSTGERGESGALNSRRQGCERAMLLVVDDDPVLREMGVACANQEGWDALEAESAEDAITILSGCSATEVYAVLSDVMMPGLSGIDLAKVLRGEDVKGFRLDPKIVKKLRGVPVVLHTSCDRYLDPSAHEGEKVLELIRAKVVSGVFKKGVQNKAVFSSLRRARRGV